MPSLDGVADDGKRSVRLPCRDCDSAQICRPACACGGVLEDLSKIDGVSHGFTLRVGVCAMRCEDGLEKFANLRTGDLDVLEGVPMLGMREFTVQDLRVPFDGL